MKEKFYKYAPLIFTISGLLLVYGDYLIATRDLSMGSLNLIFVFKIILLVGGGTLFGYLLTKYYIYSYTDHLTGLHNRQSFYTKLYKEVVKSYRYNSELVLLAIDIDKFKDINDNYGHPLGDQALVQVANVLKRNIRSTDLLGRVGGEEFFVLLPNTNLKKSYVIAECIKNQVEKEPLLFNEETVTISIGISSIKGSYDQDKLLRLADEALYKAKETRNTICVMKN